MRDSTEAEILAYYDAVARRDEATDGPDRLGDLIVDLCQVAIERDRDLIAYIVRVGVERGRGDAIAAVCRQHRGEEESAAQALAESDGVLVPIGSAQRRKQSED